MVMGGIKMYYVSCTKCDWNDDVAVNENIGNIIINLLKPQIPKQCPKCQAKTKHHENISIKF